MKVIRVWFLLILALSFLGLAGCGGGGGGATSTKNDIVVSDNTRVLSSETVVSDLRSVSTDGNTLVFTATSATKNVVAGDVIVTGISEVAPQGFIRRVTAKTFSGEEIALQTESAALADVFVSGSFSVSEPLMDEGDGTEITEIADGVTFVDEPSAAKVINIGRKKVSLDVVLMGTRDAGIVVEGSLESTLSVDFDFDIDGSRLLMLKTVPRLSSNLNAKIIAKIESAEFSKRLKLYTIKKTQVYMVGYVPVVVTYEVPIYLNFTGSAEVGIETGAVAILDIESGFLYRKGQNVDFIGDVVPAVDWIYPTVYGKLTGKLGPGVAVGITLYGTATIGTEVDSGLKLELNPELTVDPCAGARLLFNGSLYSSGKAKVDFTVFDRELWAGQYDVLTEAEYLPFSTTLVQSNEKPVVSIDAFNSSQLLAGTPVAFTQSSTDPDGNIVSYFWDFGDNGSDAGINPTHIYQNPGQYDLSLTVEDNNGCSVTKNLTVAVGQQNLPNLVGSVAGTVRDAVGDSPLAGVSVVVSLNGTTVDSTSTTASGDYSISLPEASGYAFQFIKAGFIAANYQNIRIVQNDTNYLEAVLQIDTNHAGTGVIGGKITNALTGQGVSGITVALRSGINVTSGTVVASTQTGSGGAYSIDSLAAGQYTAELSGNGFSTTYATVVCLGNTTNGNQNGSITPILAADELRVILTWGASPSDLDSHMTLPDPTSNRLHVYFSNRSVSIDGTEVSNLDVDDTSSYGPETITLYRAIDGVRYSVHNYSNRYSTNSTDLGASGAKVDVYRGSSLVARYNVPNQAGTLWTVFELENGLIRSVNSMSYEANASNVVRSLVTGGILQNDAELIRSQAVK